MIHHYCEGWILLFYLNFSLEYMLNMPYIIGISTDLNTTILRSSGHSTRKKIKFYLLQMYQMSGFCPHPCPIFSPVPRAPRAQVPGCRLSVGPGRRVNAWDHRPGRLRSTWQQDLARHRAAGRFIPGFCGFFQLSLIDFRSQLQWSN